MSFILLLVIPLFLGLAFIFTSDSPFAESRKLQKVYIAIGCVLLAFFVFEIVYHFGKFNF